MHFGKCVWLFEHSSVLSTYHVEESEIIRNIMAIIQKNFCVLFTVYVLLLTICYARNATKKGVSNMYLVITLNTYSIVGLVVMASRGKANAIN